MNVPIAFCLSGGGLGETRQRLAKTPLKLRQNSLTGNLPVSECVKFPQRGAKTDLRCFVKDIEQQFRLYRRNGGIYYIQHDKTDERESLHTRERVEASPLFAAKTQSHRQAHLNLWLACTYLTRSGILHYFPILSSLQPFPFVRRIAPHCSKILLTITIQLLYSMRR